MQSVQGENVQKATLSYIDDVFVNEHIVFPGGQISGWHARSLNLSKMRWKC